MVRIKNLHYVFLLLSNKTQKKALNNLRNAQDNC